LLNKTNSCLFICIWHDVPGVALCWLSDCGIYEWEDVSTNSNGEEEAVATSNGKEVINWIIAKRSAGIIIEIASIIIKSSVLASFFSAIGSVVVEPGDELISSFSNWVATDNGHHTEEKTNNEELGRLELIESNTSLTLSSNTNFSLFNFIPDNTGKREREDDDEHTPAHVDKGHD